MDVTVEQGEMTVSTVDIILDEPDCKVFEVDLMSKYPAECWDGSSEEDITVFIPRGPHSIKYDEDKTNLTAITIHIDNSTLNTWNVVCSSGRYTVRIVLYRARTREQVYLSD